MKFWKAEKGGVRVRLEEVIRKIGEKLREQGQKDRKKFGGRVAFFASLFYFILF